MTDFSRSNWIACGLAVTALYFAVALWLKRSYVEPPKPTGQRVIRLERPFYALLGSDLAFSVRVPALEDLSDSIEFRDRSPFVLYEDMRPLGPPHTEHAEILKYGGGR